MPSRSEEGSRDKVAFGVFCIALAALLVCGYMALGELRRGVSLDPEKGISEWLETLDQAGRDLLSRVPGGVVSRRSPEQQVEKHLRQVYRFYRDNRLKEAIEECGKAIRLDPRNPQAYYWRGLVYLKTGEHDPALEDFRVAVGLKPDFREAHDNLGWIYSRKNLPDEALFHLSRSIELNGENAWAFYHRALVFQRKGERQKALADAKKACDLKSQDGCRLYERLSSGKSL